MRKMTEPPEAVSWLRSGEPWKLNQSERYRQLLPWDIENYAHSMVVGYCCPATA